MARYAAESPCDKGNEYRHRDSAKSVSGAKMEQMQYLLIYVCIHRTLVRRIQPKVLQYSRTNATDEHVHDGATECEDTNNSGAYKGEETPELKWVKRWRT
jgi:hypothetical protein